MKKLLFTLVFALIFTPQYIWAAPNFSTPILGKAYEQVNIRIDAKVAQASLDADAKKLIEQKKAHLGEILLTIDQALKKGDKKNLKEQAGLFRASYKDTMEYIETLKSTRTTSNDHKNIPKTGGTDITYYSDSFEGGHTANGDSFSQSFYSAAVCNIPFNTLVQVGKGENSVIVKVNDRPSCTKYPNLTDLTRRAFQVLGNISSGKISGTIQTLGTVTKNYIKKTLAPDAFQELGVKLDDNIPNTYFKNETLHVTGTELLGQENTILYLQSPSKKEIGLVMKQGANGHFEYNYPLEEIGTYSLVIASGNGFAATSTILDIFVLDNALFTDKKFSPAPENVASMNTLETERIELSNMVSSFLIHFPTKDFHTLTIQDETKTVTYYGFGTIAIQPTALASFDTKKPISVKVTSQKSLTPFSHDTYTLPVTIFKKTMTLTSGYREEKNENIMTRIEGDNLIIHGIITKGKNVKSQIDITLPNGNVTEYTFDSKSIDTDGYLKRGMVFEKTIPLSDTGIYLVEVNYDNGFAAYNGPVIYGDIFPAYQSDMDTTAKDIDATDSSRVGIESLAYVNKVREKSGKKALSLDDTLNTLATIKAKDMAAHNNLSHTDSNGNKINGTAKNNSIPITGSIGENIAGGNLSFRILLIGLGNSGAHRTNMLNDWTKMGVGYVVKDGQVYYVQVFGE